MDRCFPAALMRASPRTRPEDKPPDPEHVRSMLLVEPAEAKVVRRMFESYAAGRSTKAIAEKLNADGVPAPYDSEYRKPAGRGWGSGTVRAMLRNERYLGRLVWNQREWHRDPNTGKRRSRPRPENEWVRVEAPDLRIIDDALWAKVQGASGSGGS
jgi:site-specific DNA recombinase